MGNDLKEPQYLKQQFKYCKNICWDEVIDAISKGYSTQSLTFLMSHQLDEIQCLVCNLGLEGIFLVGF